MQTFYILDPDVGGATYEVRVGWTYNLSEASHLHTTNEARGWCRSWALWGCVGAAPSED